jgi:hypothetical protein
VPVVEGGKPGLVVDVLPLTPVIFKIPPVPVPTALLSPPVADKKAEGAGPKDDVPPTTVVEGEGATPAAPTVKG